MILKRPLEVSKVWSVCANASCEICYRHFSLGRLVLAGRQARLDWSFSLGVRSLELLEMSCSDQRCARIDDNRKPVGTILQRFPSCSTDALIPLPNISCSDSHSANRLILHT